MCSCCPDGMSLALSNNTCLVVVRARYELKSFRPRNGQARVRVREDPEAQEVKEEPDDALRPRPDEVEMVQVLRRHGVKIEDAVYSLRKCGHQVEEALQYAMDTVKTRAEIKAVDNARMESEKEKDRAAKQQANDDKTLTLLGEVVPHFPKVRWLICDGAVVENHWIAAVSLRPELCTILTLANGACGFVEKATQWGDPRALAAFLLVHKSHGRRLDWAVTVRRPSRAAGINPEPLGTAGATLEAAEARPVNLEIREGGASLLLDAEDGCAIFRQYVERLSVGDGTCSQALCSFREKAVTLLFLERDAFRHYPESCCQIRGYFRNLSQRLQPGVAVQESVVAPCTKEDVGHGENADSSEEDRETKQLTARVGVEVEALQQILYHFPKTPGGVPDAFLDKRGENVATLEKDGVEEDKGRSRSPKDPVVLTIED